MAETRSRGCPLPADLRTPAVIARDPGGRRRAQRGLFSAVLAGPCLAVTVVAVIPTARRSLSQQRDGSLYRRRDVDEAVEIALSDDVKSHPIL